MEDANDMPSREVTLGNISVVPPMERVRNVVDINIHFTIPIQIKAWGCIQVRVHGKRRNKNNWYPMQVEHPGKPNYVQLLVDRENQTRDEESFLPIIESRHATMVTFRLMEDLPAGTPLVFQMHKTTIQSVSESNKEFEILIASDNIANARPVANNPTMEIKGGIFDHVRILASSNASPGQDFEVLIIFEDQFNNPTSLGIPTTASQGSTMTCSFMVQGKSTMIKEEGKLKVISRENDGATVKARFPGELLEGIIYNMDSSSNDYIFSWIGFTVHLGDESREKTFWSNPILVHSTRTAEQRESISWGLLHAHSELSDGMFSIDHYFRNIKKNMLAFGASSDHDHLFETSDADFDEIRAAVKRHDDPRGGFVAFLGYEWAKWNQNGDGDKCVYFFDDVKAMLRSGDPAFNRSTKLYAALERFENKVLIIPHHTAFEGNPCTWEHWDPVHERLVEIYSIWGCSERSVHDGNPRPVRKHTPELLELDKRDLDRWEIEEGFIVNALRKGARLGFTAGGDDHIGHPGEHRFLGYNGLGYPPGLVAVVTQDGCDREKIWKALWSRCCYGTTGARIWAIYRVNGAPMGSELSMSQDPSLATTRTISGIIAGDAKIKKVEITRNGKTWHILDEVNVMRHEFSVVDYACFQDVFIPGKNAPHAGRDFMFYYLRIFQEDGEIAWLSPTWILHD